MKLLPYFCGLVIAAAFMCWGILSINIDAFGPKLAGLAFFAVGAAILIYLVYDAIEQIKNSADPETYRIKYLQYIVNHPNQFSEWDVRNANRQLDELYYDSIHKR